MDIRSNESPMDFQWQKGHGPARPDSPFLKAAANYNQHHHGFTGQKCESCDQEARASTADAQACI